MTENLSTDFGIANGRTTIMSLNSSGRNFVVSSSAKVVENGRAEDADETSSGYSSRESRYGEKRDSRGSSHKVPPKIVLLVEEEERTAPSVNGSVAVGKKSHNMYQISGELIEAKRESPVVFNADSQLEDRVLLSKQEASSLENRIVTDCDTELKDCIKSYSTRSRSEETVGLADSRTIRRQPRIEVEDDTCRHFPTDKTKEKEFEVNVNPSKRGDSSICFSQKKEVRDGATQTDFAYHEIFEECLNLKKVNCELVEKLNTSNNRFAVTIKYLEKQLNNAASEISKLKSHLLSVNVRSSCNRCGYCSDGEVTVLQRQSSSETRRNSINSNGMKKAVSTNSLKTYPYHQTYPASQLPKLLKCIVKGENPDEVKTSLLEKNKSLKDEIQYLKEKERNGLASNKAASRNQDSSENVDDLVVDKQTTADSNTLRDEKEIVEDVRWKQNGYRVARRQKRSTTNRPQCTSAAFRTIHVTKWGPQM